MPMVRVTWPRSNDCRIRDGQSQHFQNQKIKNVQIETRESDYTMFYSGITPMCTDHKCRCVCAAEQQHFRSINICRKVIISTQSLLCFVAYEERSAFSCVVDRITSNTFFAQILYKLTFVFLFPIPS